MKSSHKKLPLLLLIPSLLVGCQNTDTPTESSTPNTEPAKPVEKLEITGVTHIGVREYTTMTCSYQGKLISPQWTSSDKKVATVSTTGMVKGISIGDVTITASYNGLSSDFSLSVTESWALSSVVSRIASSSYQVKMTGEGGDFDSMSNPSFTLDCYENGFYYEGGDSDAFVADYGVGVDAKKRNFYYEKDATGKISNALYFRDQSLGITSRFYGLSILPATYYRMDLREDNTYDLMNNSLSAYFQALYFFMGTQFISTEEKDFMEELQSSVLSLTMTVNGTNSLTVNMGFGRKVDEEEIIDETIKLEIQSLADKNDAILASFLDTSSPAFPEVYPEITKLYELSKNHNYTRDFGNYTGDGISIHIGQSYFTDKYIFIEYTPEYLEETKGAYEENPLISRGYVDIYGKKDYQDGSYYFEYKDGKVNVGSREMNSSTGKFYSHWYDFYENLTLILDMLSDDFYMFDRIQASGSAFAKEFGSYSQIGASITEELFSDYLQAISGMTASGIILSIDYSDENPSDTIAMVGGLFTYNSNLAYDFQKYPYTKFNTTSSKVMDDFLNSLIDR